MLASVEQVSVAQLVYEQIRNAIFAGQFQPGQRLDVRGLASTFQTSTQPVKEALQRLRLEGMVIIKPRSGTFVRNLTPAEAREILEVRLMMESFAISRRFVLTSEGEAALTRPAQAMVELLQRMVEGLSGGTIDWPRCWAQYNEWDAAFHEQLVALAGNSELLRIYRALHSHYATGRFYYKNIEKTIKDTPDHFHIIEALRAGDYERAQALVERHILSGIRVLAESFSASGPEPEPAERTAADEEGRQSRAP